jgi:hypothetical protein
MKISNVINENHLKMKEPMLNTIKPVASGVADAVSTATSGDSNLSAVYMLRNQQPFGQPLEKRWVEVRVMCVEQSLEIIRFLLWIGKRPRPFKTDDMIAFNTKALNFKTSPRILRDLRQKGLIKYEVTDRRLGIYELQSSYTELLQARAWLEQGGYYINDESPIMLSNKFVTSVEQMSLI